MKRSSPEHIAPRAFRGGIESARTLVITSYRTWESWHEPRAVKAWCAKTKSEYDPLYPKMPKYSSPVYLSPPPPITPTTTTTTTTTTTNGPRHWCHWPRRRPRRRKTPRNRLRLQSLTTHMLRNPTSSLSLALQRSISKY